MWTQYEIRLKPKSRGFHLVTDEILAQVTALRQIKVGLMQVFIKHTSAAVARWLSRSTGNNATKCVASATHPDKPRTACTAVNTARLACGWWNGF